ncbi:MAG: signal peptidase II [Chlamydiales bacterium]|nr:signal peptidase II [Chlamydiales bacterium]
MKKSVRHLWLYCGLFAGLLLLDFLSKWWVQSHLVPMQWAPHGYPYGGVGVFANFLGIEMSIVHVGNRGAAWGSFSGMHLPLLIMRMLITGLLLIYILIWNKVKQQIVPLVMILAGAIGNIIDCFVYGHVVDMIHLNFGGYSYPVFNLADAYICLGVAVFIVQSFIIKKKCK